MKGRKGRMGRKGRKGRRGGMETAFVPLLPLQLSRCHP